MRLNHTLIAAAGADYETASGLVQFRPGQASRTIEVELVDDDLDEDAETLDVRLEMLPGLAGSGPAAVTTAIIVD